MQNKDAIQDSNTPAEKPLTKKNIPWILYIFFILTLAAGIAVGYIWWGRQAISQKGLTTSQLIWMSLQTDAPSWGPTDAPVTIVEFSDYECSFCTRWHNEVWPQLTAAYKGKIRLVYRDFPLTQIHPNSVDAAIAAYCAGEQNQYWEYHDLLFLQKMELSSLAYEAYATRLELNLPAFKECQTSTESLTYLQREMETAQMLGIDGTPTFFINGYRLKGTQPFEEFQKIIDTILAGD